MVAKKNILCWLKGMKGRLFAILKKPQKGKDKNLLSTAAEKKSMSLKLPNVTMGDAIDTEIWRCMETIEFNFGHKTYTTKEAGLLFAYETGMECGRMYVIALSDNCGTIIFYIPDDLLELISERAEKLMCSPGKYIVDLIEFKDAATRTLRSMAATGVTVKEATAALNVLIDFTQIYAHSAAKATAALIRLENALTKYKRPEGKTNNWLKMHGLPMQRKGKERKERE